MAKSNLEIHNEAVQEAKKAVKEMQEEYIKNNHDNNNQNNCDIQQLK